MPDVLKKSAAVYHFTPKQKRSLIAKLQGYIGWTELGKEIGCTKQQAVNLTAIAACQFVREGDLVVSSKNLRHAKR